VRIRVSESVAIPSITRLEDGRIELLINTGFSFEEIRAAIGDVLSETEYEQVHMLWADDLASRKFIPIDGSTDVYIQMPDDSTSI
jgi:hypothetical protein